MQKTVFITGADKGLGLSLTRRFIADGFHVFAGNYFSGEELLKVSGLFPGKLSLVGMDVTNLESMRKATKSVVEQSPALDILINNAAVYLQKPVKPL